MPDGIRLKYKHASANKSDQNPTLLKTQAAYMTKSDKKTGTVPSSEKSSTFQTALYEQEFQAKQHQRKQKRARSESQRSSSERNSHQLNPAQKTFWPYALYAGAATQFIFPVLRWKEASAKQYDRSLQHLAESVTMQAIAFALCLAALGFVIKCLTDLRWIQAEKVKKKS